MPRLPTTVKIEGVSSDSDKERIKKGLEETLKMFQNGTPVKVEVEGPQLDFARIMITNVSATLVPGFSLHICRVFTDMNLQEPDITVKLTRGATAAGL